MSEKRPRRFLSQGIELLTNPRGRDLDGYIFQDEAHAREWLSQSFVSDDAYKVAIVQVGIRSCCGRRYAKKRLRTLRVGEFLHKPATPPTEED
jgi:hypothetical protein